MTKNVCKKNIIVNGDKQFRSFVHVADVARSIIFFSNLKKNLFIIFITLGQKNNIRIIDLAKLFKKYLKI